MPPLPRIAFRTRLAVAMGVLALAVLPAARADDAPRRAVLVLGKTQLFEDASGYPAFSKAHEAGGRLAVRKTTVARLPSSLRTIRPYPFVSSGRKVITEAEACFEAVTSDDSVSAVTRGTSP